MRDWKGERNWWLDHFFQYIPGARRKSRSTQLNVSDYMAVPLPLNVPTPLAPPYLIWRWSLDTSGYGRIKGKGAHVVAYEMSRGEQIAKGTSILHLCHRPFCVQPAHLYAGNAKENSEDTAAVRSEMGHYASWETLGDRWDRASTQFYWAAPNVEILYPNFGLDAPLQCPHSFIRPAGDAKLCANCGITNPESISKGHRDRCEIPVTCDSVIICRCLLEPCQCKLCSESDAWRGGMLQ